MERSDAHQQRKGENMLKDYLLILEESLQKKLNILLDIEQINQEQMEIMQTDPVDLEKYDACVDKKDGCIKELEKLDEGFETVYDNIKAELSTQKDSHRGEIKRIQELIGEIMDKSVSVQAQEERNRQLVSTFFKKERQNIGQGRKSSQAALNYYRNMSNTNVAPPYVIDKKVK